MAEPGTQRRHSVSRTPDLLALSAAFLVPFAAYHSLVGVAAGVLATIAVWSAAAHRAWTALRVGVLVVLLAGLTVVSAPQPIWLALGGVWLASRRFHRLRPGAGWLPPGKPSAVTNWFTVLVVASAAVALTVWATNADEFGDATTEVAEAASDVPVLLLVLGALVFVVCNAITEEIAYRVLVMDSALALTSPAIAVLVQGLAFGLIHVNGFPAGVVGVALATVYGISLGVLRVMSDGMRASVVAHLAADATIAVLFFVVVVPAAT